MKKYNLYGFSVAVMKHQMIEKVFEVRERIVQVGQGMVRRKVAIASSASFRELRAEAWFRQGSMVCFFLSEETNRSQRLLKFDVC